MSILKHRSLGAVIFVVAFLALMQFKTACFGQATNIQEFPITQTAAAFPAGLTYVPTNNAFWFNIYEAGAIGRIDTISNIITETLISNYTGAYNTSASPFGMTLGPDGNLWFTQTGAGMLARINPGNSNMVQYALSNTLTQPFTLITGPDQRLWFIEYVTSKIAVVDINHLTNSDATLKFTEFGPFGTNILNGSPGTNAEMYGLASGPDGNVWFTQGSLGAVGNISTDGHTTNTFQLPGIYCEPSSIVAGPDNAMWFTEFTSNKIGRISLNGAMLTEFVLPLLPAYPLPEPYHIIKGPDGNLWFSEYNGSAVGRIMPSTNASKYNITIFQTPTISSIPTYLATDQTNIWFGEFSSGGGSQAYDHISKLLIGQSLILNPMAAATAGTTFNGSLASFQNSNPINTVTVTWGDGTSDTVTVTSFTNNISATNSTHPANTLTVMGTGTNGVNGTFLITAAHSYSTISNYPVTITVNDSNNAMAVAGYPLQAGPSVVVQPVTLGANLVSTNLVLNWPGANFSLLSATNILGPWTTVSGATSPYTNSLGGSQRFFKLKSN